MSRNTSHPRPRVQALAAPRPVEALSVVVLALVVLISILITYVHARPV